MEKKLDGNCTRMLRTVLSKSKRQHTKQQLYGHLPPITKTINVRRTRHAGHCWRSKNELISDVLLWTPSHGRANVGQPARTNIQQLYADTGCSLEDLQGAMALELFYCNENICLEGTIMFVTAGRKWYFLEMTPPAESITMASAIYIYIYIYGIIATATV